MGAFYFKQPNGLYGRFSTVVDCPTDYNCTKEELIDDAVETYRQELMEEFDKRCKSFEYMVSQFYDNSMTNEEFEEAKKEMSEPVDESDFGEDGISE
jgi:hypothetical protein